MSTLEVLRESLAASYDIEREVGRGGMARVYLAHDRKHDRKVALKVIDSEVAMGMAAERFLLEIRLCARLTHPHILPLLDSGYAGDRPFFVMPFVDGESIRDRLVRIDRFPVDDAVALVSEVADALNYAHAAGVLHRDIKPENVLLLGTHAVVLDFGVGRAISAASERAADLTVAGTFVGTRAYMSPEQAAGETTLDGRSDEYALAVMLYEMLTGEQPFRGPNAQAVIAKRFFESAPALDQKCPAAPPHIVHAVARALAREADDRFATVGEFGRALVSGSTSAAAAPRPAQLPSIAVVPFANVGTHPDNEFLSDGITDEVISALSRLRTLRVAARTSSYAIRDQRDDVSAIGAKLKVESLLEGSVQRAGNRIRVKARLIKVSDGFHLWSEQFDRELDDIFAIQDAISAAIVQALKTTILGGMQVAGIRAAPTNPAAYEPYLKGRFFWNKRTEASLARAVDLFGEAIAADPNYAPAHAGLADVYAVLGTYGARAPRDVMPIAQQSAERALALDPSLAEPHATLGLIAAVFARDWAKAEASFGRALTLDPASVTGHQWRAISLLVPMGRMAEAKAAIERARALDPLSTVVGMTAGVVRTISGDLDGGIEIFRDVLALDAGFGMAHFFLGQALIDGGHYAEAKASVERAIALTGGSAEMLSRLAQAKAGIGDGDGAAADLATLTARRAVRYTPASQVALVHIALGQPDAAMEWLRTAQREDDPELVYLTTKRAYEPLRPRPDFLELVRAVQLDS